MLFDGPTELWPGIIVLMAILLVASAINWLKEMLSKGPPDKRG